MSENDGSVSISLGSFGISGIVCAIIAILFIQGNCSTHIATGYTADICERGYEWQDILGLLCCSPFYLLYLIILGGAHFGWKLW